MVRIGAMEPERNFVYELKGPKIEVCRVSIRISGKSFYSKSIHSYYAGQVYFWATIDVDGKWNINRVELELNSQHDRRLLVKDGPYDPE